MIQRIKEKKERIERKKARIRRKIRGTTERPRLTIFRSAKHIYTQLIDDTTGRTLIAVSSISKDVKDEISKTKTPIERCKLIGLLTAKKAIEKNIKEVVFDRRAYQYHGRVRAIADGAREGGLKF